MDDDEEDLTEVWTNLFIIIGEALGLKRRFSVYDLRRELSDALREVRREFTPEAGEEERPLVKESLETLGRCIQRVRKLKAADYQRIVYLRKEKKMSWRQIGRQVGVSHEAARAAFRKVQRQE